MRLVEKQYRLDLYRWETKYRFWFIPVFKYSLWHVKPRWRVLFRKRAKAAKYHVFYHRDIRIPVSEKEAVTRWGENKWMWPVNYKII